MLFDSGLGTDDPVVFNVLSFVGGLFDDVPEIKWISAFRFGFDGEVGGVGRSVQVKWSRDGSLFRVVVWSGDGEMLLARGQWRVSDPVFFSEVRRVVR
jgi:hypothetical protein